MKQSLDEALRLYDYALPRERIALSPARPRDSAKLLVYSRSTGTVQFGRFRDIGKYLPSGSVLILNETKVIPARITAGRATGGKVALLFLERTGRRMRALANRSLHEGELLRLSRGKELRVIAREGNAWTLQILFAAKEFVGFMERNGAAPLPPYIKHSPLSERERRKEYQTVFARRPGSVAAPTASLHFTTALLRSLKRRGIHTAKITLHVNLGTFAPLTEEQWRKGRLHRERYSIGKRSQEIIGRAREQGNPIIAVGTTAVRTLESACDRYGRIKRPHGSTDLFIREGNKIRLTEGLITNFHVPKSSLLMLVSAFVGREKLFELYGKAIERHFRFFSFGDAMLIL